VGAVILPEVLVTLDMYAVRALTDADTWRAVRALDGALGRCTRLYAKDGWDFAAVDFGDEGTWNGPVFMLRPVLADA
jgi:hypothetical protein